jgi:hypothetical protein
MARAGLSGDGRTLSVHIPMAVKRRDGRKVILGPDGGQPKLGTRGQQVRTALVKALARAHRWYRLLESGRFATIGDLARAERVNASYLARILRLALLAPEIVEAILDERQPEGVTLVSLTQPFPVKWEAQLAAINLAN